MAYTQTICHAGLAACALPWLVQGLHSSNIICGEPPAQKKKKECESVIAHTSRPSSTACRARVQMHLKHMGATIQQITLFAASIGTSQIAMSAGAGGYMSLAR
jgi:hypothetical protein